VPRVADWRGDHRVVPFTDPDDVRLADYTGLRESTLRRRGSAFIAEGELVVRRAAAAGYVPRSFLLAPRWVDTLSDVWSRYDVPVYVAGADVVESLTGFHVHRGALAAYEREERYEVASLLARSRRLVVVEDLVDHANLGAIARSTLALGWDGLLLSSRSADPLYRRAVKSSMGVVLDLPWARAADDTAVPGLLRSAGFDVVALALRDDAVPLDEVAVRHRGRDVPLAILLGTEGQGLSTSWLAGADTVARIPMAAGVDSLNVAAAAAVACYVLRPSAAGH
jgi:tRNA G18 (ribose-2'-O)-methylase SpoU